LEKLTNKKCPSCGKLFREKHPNIALIEFIPLSSFDKLKGECSKALIEKILTKQSDLMLNELNASLDASIYEDSVSFDFA